MKERLQIAKHANLVDEAILILYQWVNADAFEQLREEYRDNYPDNPEEYNHIWDTVLEIYYAVKEELKPKKDRVDYYFKSRNANFFFNASFAFLWSYQNPDNRLLTYEERIKGMKEAERIKAYAQIINIDEEEEISAEGLLSCEDFLSFLDAASCEKDAKWDVLRIFHNQEESYNEVTAILKEVVDLLENRFTKQITALEKQYYEYWQAVQAELGIMELLKQNLKLTWKENENGTILLPMIFQPISVTLSYEQDTDCMDVLRFGILMDQRFIISRQKMDAEDIVNFGKLLSDKSKVDILELTAKKPCYGKEIAKELGLSTATISYHVNALIKLGLLKTEVNSNRVYYSMNMERISEYLEGIKGFFVSK